MILQKIKIKLYKKNQHRIRPGAGFTLVELLVSISILMIMTMMVLVNYNISGRNSALLLEAHKFAGDVRRAQNMAMGSFELESIATVPAGGWGIYIPDSAEDNTYYIFADIDGNEDYDNLTDEIFETMTLQNNVSFTAGSLNNSIIFLPPDPRTFINGEDIDGLSVDSEITIIFSSEAGTKDVYLNDLGLIDIED
ncbi:MAG: prepilin-type N-terminal cleavage/methylation domain-containing protein [Patescibacteria group bacterium]|jgi:Tfp pilus assembly protein FimT